nr:uncharacterized protein LOC129529277 [Gorilla gorilla gorilla]
MPRDPLRPTRLHQETSVTDVDEAQPALPDPLIFVLPSVLRFAYTENAQLGKPHQRFPRTAPAIGKDPQERIRAGKPRTPAHWASVPAPITQHRARSPDLAAPSTDHRAEHPARRTHRQPDAVSAAGIALGPELRRPRLGPGAFTTKGRWRAGPERRAVEGPGARPRRQLGARHWGVAQGRRIQVGFTGRPRDRKWRAEPGIGLLAAPRAPLLSAPEPWSRGNAPRPTTPPRLPVGSARAVALQAEGEEDGARSASPWPVGSAGAVPLKAEGGNRDPTTTPRGRPLVPPGPLHCRQTGGETRRAQRPLPLWFRSGPSTAGRRGWKHGVAK